jgi:hypothetical protein
MVKRKHPRCQLDLLVRSGWAVTSTIPPPHAGAQMPSNDPTMTANGLLVVVRLL